MLKQNASSPPLKKMEVGTAIHGLRTRLPQAYVLSEVGLFFRTQRMSLRNLSLEKTPAWCKPRRQLPEGGPVAMMGTKKRAFAPIVAVSREALVPANHFFQGHINQRSKVPLFASQHERSLSEAAAVMTDEGPLFCSPYF
jgi:putative SOS response-associated peptidase YedK